jgi:peptide/nickel transport system substrate-binding protein
MLRRFAAIMLMAVSSVAVACGSGTGTTTTSDSTATDPNATLTFAFSTDASSNYDPHAATNQFVNTYLYPVYDRLINFTPDAKLEPMLAESWSFGDGGKSMTLKLRKNVTFHDGAAFNADAVVGNIDRAKNYAKSTVKPDLASVDNAVAVDQYTVKLNLNGPAGSLPALLADRAGIMVSPTALKNTDLDLHPVGAGPFKVSDVQPGKQMTYTKFDKYWNPSAQRVAKIVVPIMIDTNARIRALRDGSIQAAPMTPDVLDQVSSSKDIKVQADNTLSTFLLYLNLSRPGLNNVKARQALSYAIDRQTIAKGLHGGYCTPTAQIFPATYWASDPKTAANLYPFDTVKAKQMLTEAGVPNGFAFTTSVINVPFYSSQAEAIQAQLAKIGVTMKVQALEPAQLLSSFQTSKTADAYFSQWPGSVDPAKTVAALYTPRSLFNPGGYTDEVVVKEASEGLAATDQAQRAPHYQAISKEVATQMLSIPVCSAKTLSGVGSKVRNLKVNPAGAYDLTYAQVIKS